MIAEIEGEKPEVIDRERITQEAVSVAFELDKLLDKAEINLGRKVKLGTRQRERLKDVILEMFGAEPDEDSLRMR